MGSKPLVISGSARKNGNTNTCLTTVFNGMPYQLSDLSDYVITPYTYSNPYPDEDGFMDIVAQMIAADTIILATPVYWYAMSGLMKTFFDRLTDLVTREKAIGRQLSNKSIFLFVVGSDEEIPPGFEVPFKLTADYFGSSFKDYLYICTKEQVQYPIAAQSAFLYAILNSTSNTQLNS